MIITSLGTGVGYLKAGFLGFAGSGKTYTAALLLIGLRRMLGLTGPIAMFDTEKSAQYIAPLVKKETGIDLIGCQSRSFDDAVAFHHEAMKAGACAFLYDSVTHIWMDLSKSFLAQRNAQRASQGKNPTNRLEFQDWALIKNKWASFSDLYLNAPAHAVINGRAGYEWDFEDREDGTGKDLVKTGIKMKAEGEFGFEPSLLVQMERIQTDAEEAASRREEIRAAGGKVADVGNSKVRSAVYVRRATVIKDRFGVIDGMSCDNPTFEFFKPYVSCLVPGQHVEMDMTPHTDMGLDEEGRSKDAREKRERNIAIEEFWAALLVEWPGASALEKLARQEVVYKLLETRSQTAVEAMSAGKLKAALQAMPVAIAEYKAEAQKKADAEAAVEAEAKAAKKAPKRAEEVKA